MAGTRTILLIDDDEEILAGLRTGLEQAGFRVVTAADGNLGLAVAESEAPDLVVLDMMMPKKSGFLVLEKLRARPGGPPVIMITANEGARHRAYAEQLGVQAYLAKPFDLAELLEHVRRVLR